MRSWNWGSVAGGDTLVGTLNQRLKELSGVVSRGERVASVKSDYTAGWADDVVLATTALTVTLPPVASVRGQYLIVCNGQDGRLTIAADGAELIDNERTNSMSGRGAWALLSDGKVWHIVGGHRVGLGEASGYASLDSAGRVPENQWPEPFPVKLRQRVEYPEDLNFLISLAGDFDAF